MDPTKKNAARAALTAILIVGITAAIVPHIKAAVPRSGDITFTDQAATGVPAVQGSLDAAYRAIASDESRSLAPIEEWSSDFVARQADRSILDRMQSEAKFEYACDQFNGVRGSITLESLTVQGDRAVVLYHYHIEPGDNWRHLADDQSCEDDWTHFGGTWLITATSVVTDQITINHRIVHGFRPYDN